MPGEWTAEQILALAPDPASAKAGRDLASGRKWVSTGRSGQVVFGECQGSGKDPYRTVIDLSEPAFKCSCPSRKFPCKHSLGLFLYYQSSPGSIAESDAPAWVNDWIKGRASRAEKKAEKAESAAPADPAAQAKRLADRQKKVAAGLEDARLWLHDLVRQGIAAAPSQPFSFWEQPAARLIDAQAPGAARLIREAGASASSGAGWHDRLLDRLAGIHLLLEGYSRLDALPPDTQADVRTLVGFNPSQDDLLTRDGVRDAWVVVGQRVEQEEKLRVRRTWLLSESGGRQALLLHFAFGTQPFDEPIAPATVFDAEIVYFPSAMPLRALLKARHGDSRPATRLPAGFSRVADALTRYAKALGAVPWIERFPLAVTGVIPHIDGDAWSVRDAEGGSLPLSPRSPAGWRLMALSGGRPIDLFGEWDGDSLLPQSAVGEEGFTLLPG